MSRQWTRREKVTGVVAIILHLLIVWNIWETSLQTPRNIQFINCEGEVTHEQEVTIKKEAKGIIT